MGESKMDRQGARTPSDLERRHDWGKKFAAILGMIDDSREYVYSLESKLSDEIKEQYTAIIRDSEAIVLNAFYSVFSGEGNEEEIESELKVAADAVSALVQSTETLKNEMQSTTELLNTTAEILNGEIRTAVSSHTDSLSNVDDRFESIIADYESKISQTANKFQIDFAETVSQLETANGKLDGLQSNLEKHFTFNQNGITITAGKGSMDLVLDNDIIRFEKDGVEFGSWDGTNFHTGNIVIDLNEKAQLGNFAFIPRSDGSLSFLKVGG